jgi:hypothetical protein
MQTHLVLFALVATLATIGLAQDPPQTDTIDSLLQASSEQDNGALSERVFVEDALQHPLQNQVESTDLQESQHQQNLESSRATLRKGYYGGGYGYDGRRRRGGGSRGEEEIEEKSHENDDQEQLEHELHEEKRRRRRRRRYKYKVTSQEELQQDSDLDSSDKMADLLTASLETESKADEGLSERLFVQDALKEPLKEGPLQSQVENTDIQESERQKDREASRSTLRKGYYGGYGYDGRRRRGGGSRGEEEIETASSETDGSTRPEDDDGGLSERLAVEDALQNQVENTDLQESQRQQALESSRATLRKGYYYGGGGYGYDGRRRRSSRGEEQIQEKSKEKSRSYASLRKGSSRGR